MRVLKWFLLMLGLSSCQKANDIAAMICGTGNARGQMTLGLNLDVLKECSELQV